MNEKFKSNQDRVTHREKLFVILKKNIEALAFETLFDACLKHQVPIAKIRNLKEVFELTRS